MEAPGQPDLNREDSLGYQVNHLARLLEQALRKRIEPHGVVPGQFAQLLALYEQDGLTQRELHQRVRIDQSTLAHTLGRMERDGLIRRGPDPDDGRRIRITLTDRAREAKPQLIPAATEVNATATAGLTGAEVETFMRTVAHLIDNLEAARESAVDRPERVGRS